MKSVQNKIVVTGFLLAFLFAASSLLLLACNKTEVLDSSTPAPPTEKPMPEVNPDDFTGCKRKCLKHDFSCVRMSPNLFGQYERDFVKLYSDAKQIPTAEEFQIDISEDSILDMKHLIISNTHGIRVRQHDIKDPDLEILSSENKSILLLKFKIDAVDSDYGGPITRIQFYQRQPIFTTGKYNCVGVYDD
mgnify:CR=1 FL=1